MIRFLPDIVRCVVSLILVTSVVSCDSVQPDAPASLVVEAFFRAGERPSPVLLRATVPLGHGAAGAGSAVATGAKVELEVNDERVGYLETSPGRYLAADEYTRVLEPGDVFDLTIEWDGALATASGSIPPPIHLDSLMVSAPSSPVEAILVDSLRLDTLGVDARTGLIYPVETTVWWTVEAGRDPSTWVQTQLRPRREFSSVVVDFFLLPEDVFREADLASDASDAVSWTGLYAVPVQNASDPVPVHELRVALVRSNKAYAEFAASRSDAGGREPPTNVTGALGIAVGLSVDSVSVQVDPAVVRRKSIVFEGEAPSGLITAVEVQKKDPNRVSIFIEGEFAFGIHSEVARKFELGRGLGLTASTAAAALKADAAHRAFSAGMSLLSHRARTEFEMRQRLMRKGFDQEAVDEAIRRLHDRAYLDDRGFAREYASSRVTSRGEGLYRIRGDLLKRGVARGIVDEVTSELEPEIDWTEVARIQARKRWERIRNSGDERRRRKKMLDFLVRKGFDHSTALGVIAELEEG